jgi:outer membrane protein assembly factor BamD
VFRPPGHDLMKLPLIHLCLLLLLPLTGCGLFPETEDETADWSAAKFYSEAKQALDDGDYESAIRYYELLEARYPFGRYAQQAQLDLAYAYYRSDQPDSAIAACDRFIKLYPGHPNVDYAYYLKGLVNYNRGLGLLQRYLPVDHTQRDPGVADDSFNDFAEVVSRYPHSKYAEDSRQRMIALRNQLAQYEIHVARYYMKRRAYVAAANRASGVVQHYQETPSVPEALAIMVETYRILELNQLADDARRVLQLNYPNHPAINEEGIWVGEKKSLWDRLLPRW